MSSDLLKKMIDETDVTIMSKSDLQILGDIMEQTVCDSSSVFSMMLNTTATVSVTEVKEYQEFNTEVTSNISDGVSVEVNFEEGITGVNLFYFNAQETIRLANSTMGASVDAATEETELGDLQVSVFGEVMSQFFSKMEKTLATMFETKIGSLSPLVKKQEVKSIDISYSVTSTPGIYIKYTLEIENSKPIFFHQVISEALANDMIGKYRQAKGLYDGKPHKHTEEPEEETDDILSTSPVTVQPIKFSSFDNAPQVTSDNKNLDLLMDIKLKLTVELGRTEMPIKKVLELSRGSVIELDKIAGEPVDLYANGKLIASGEVIVIEDNFGLRITNILSPDNRIKNI